jgi:hypothetical protein
LQLEKSWCVAGLEKIVLAFRPIKGIGQEIAERKSVNGDQRRSIGRKISIVNRQSKERLLCSGRP